MSRASELRKQRREKANPARRRAETHSSGFSSTVLRLPDGLGFWKRPEQGLATIDIVPYKAGKLNMYAEQGDDAYELTFWTYKKIGANEDSYVCLSKVFNKPDPIAEFRQKIARDKDKEDQFKALAPKERQLFLIWDHDDKDKGLQLWENSFHQFGKLLDDRLQNRGTQDWDQFWYTDEGGFSLQITFKKTEGYGTEARAIDFLPREEPLPKNIAEHKYVLDNMLVEVPYEKMKSIFLMSSEETEPAQENDNDDSYQRDQESSREVEDDDVPFDKPATKKEEPKEEKQYPTAEERGLKRGDTVKYEGKLLTIMKISPDGTSLMLVDDDTDEVFKAVSPDEVKKPGSGSAKNDDPKPATKQKNKEQPEKSSKDEEDWDSDWD